MESAAPRAPESVDHIVALQAVLQAVAVRPSDSDVHGVVAGSIHADAVLVVDSIPCVHVHVEAHVPDAAALMAVILVHHMVPWDFLAKAVADVPFPEAPLVVLLVEIVAVSNFSREMGLVKRPDQRKHQRVSTY